MAAHLLTLIDLVLDTDPSAYLPTRYTEPRVGDRIAIDDGKGSRMVTVVARRGAEIEIR